MRLLFLGLLIVFSMTTNSLMAQEAEQNTGKAADKIDNSFIQQPLFTDAVNYERFAKQPGCQEERVRIVKYHGCRDSKALYEAALASAKAKGQPLMVIFGFNKCPYCVVLDQQIFDPNRPLRGGNVARYYSTAELETYMARKQALTIPVLRLHARSRHGLKLADELGMTQMAKDRGWHRVWSPFVVFVNPETGAMASESEWEAKEIYCDWSVNIAVSLENIDMIEKGVPYTDRTRCPKS